MSTLDVIWEWIISGLVQNFIWMIVAILVVQTVQNWIDKRRYGRWRVIVRQQGMELVNREISPGKFKEIINEPSEMSVFIKGVASPYAWINCDVLTEGKDLKLFVDEPENRCLIIDLDKNPTEKNTSKKTEQKAVRRTATRKKKG